MKLIVFSDSHRELSYMREAIALEQPDFLLHLGDHDRDAEQLGREYPMLPLLCVRGNCDGWSDTPLTLTAVYGGVRIFLCHGHSYGVKGGPLRAIFAAREQQADVLLFGHTHTPFLEETEDGLTILNPGACGGWRPSYGLIGIEPGKHRTVCWKTFDGEVHT